ncbi:Uncharacterized protein BM_BM10294 [Brugia malayi]|uniref:Bm10294 n=1 Tax=Brugia malayi TaxID=6279 RepID=A0A0K0IMR2_BRUMA|nr:Uncharacterized protein BM_BM10294 [Brugia malayi]CDP97496.1 Bm10294 [Brugia malayi]VIO99911.1 Uncharacterized protein BM_BM10294 [Brugia malayi]
MLTKGLLTKGAIDGTVGGGAIGGGSGEQERSGAAITSFPTLESAEIRTSSSQESASNLKRRPKFEQISL